jgi:hypothetical protein
MSWFAAGAVAGTAASLYARHKVAQAAERLTPNNVARRAATRARLKASDVADAVREGRKGMKEREAELIATRDGAAGEIPAMPVVVIADPAALGIRTAELEAALNGHARRRSRPPRRR